MDNKIVKQLEYYFGDINLPRDKFLQEKLKEDDGWISLDVLTSFKRLANLTTDHKVIIEAVKDSSSEIIEINEESKKIRRLPDKPLPEMNDERKKLVMARTAYAKGFPLEESLDSIINFMEKFGEIDSCIKRTYPDKATKTHIFKGSCFIIFKNEEDCKKFVEAESIKHGDVELVRKMQEIYFNEKKKELDLKRSQRKNDRKSAKEEKVVEKFKYPLGAVFHFTISGESEKLTREQLKEKIAEVSKEEPAFIYFNKGDKEGDVRMPKENCAVELYKELSDGVLEINDAKLAIKVLEGDEEKAFLEKVVEDINKRRKQNKGKKFGKKRFSNRDSKDEPQSKKIKA